MFENLFSPMPRSKPCFGSVSPVSRVKSPGLPSSDGMGVQVGDSLADESPDAAAEPFPPVAPVPPPAEDGSAAAGASATTGAASVAGLAGADVPAVELEFFDAAVFVPSPSPVPVFLSSA